MPNLNFQVTDNRTLILMGEVAEIVQQGGTITISRYDRLNEFARYLDNNKRNMMLTAGSLIATTAISGPIGLAVAAGGKLIMFVGKSVIQAFRLRWSTGRYTERKRSVLQQRQDKAEDLIWKRVGNDLVFDTTYGDVLIEDVTYMLENRALTDIYNAFANLDADFQKFNKFAGGAFPPAGWKQGTFGAVRVVNKPDLSNPALLDTDTRAGKQDVPACNRIRINSSDDAVELWEACCRIQFRYQKVAQPIETLGEFVEYVTASISVFDADAVPRSRRLWDMITDNGRKDAGLIMDILNDAGNRINRKFGFVTDFWRWVTGKGDYRLWAYSLLPEHIRNSAKGVQLAAIRLSQPDKYKMIMKQIAEKTYGSAKEFAGFDPAQVKSVGTWTEYVSSLGIDATGGFIQNLFAKEKEKLGGAQAAFEGGYGKFFQAEAGIQAAVEAVAGVIAEAANQIWTQYQLETGKTFSITKGVHQQSIASRIGLIRDLAKEAAGAYVEVIDAWKEGYDNTDTAANPQDAAYALLLYHSAEKAYYSNPVGRMLEETINAIVQLRDLANEFTENAAQSVEIFLKKDEELFTGAGGHFYYGSLKKALKDMSYIIVDKTLEKEAEKAPVIKVDGSNLLKQTFTDKSVFLSNQIAHSPLNAVNPSVFPQGAQPWVLGMPTEQEFRSATSAGRGFLSTKTGEITLQALYVQLQKLFSSTDRESGRNTLQLIQKGSQNWLNEMQSVKSLSFDELLSKYEQAKAVNYLKKAAESKSANLYKV